jgi:excisionase family DNA binding protein
MLNPDKMYSLPEAGDFLGLKRTAIYDRIKAGEIRAVKVGRLTKVYGRDIQAFVASLPALGTAA